MRFDILDLGIAIFIMAVPAAVLASLLPVGRHLLLVLLMIVLQLIVYLVVSSPIYRFFHFYPLFLPKCPKCGDNNRHYLGRAREWPMEIIECALCEAQIELCTDPSKKRPDHPDLPQFELLWPYSFGGRWRRV